MTGLASCASQGAAPADGDLVTASAVDASSSPNSAESESSRWLLTLRAQGATVQRDGGQVTLNFEEMDSTLVAFTDRPQRRAETVPVASLTAEWTRIFGDDPPNAAISVDDSDAVYVVTLGAPIVSSSGEVSFPATEVPEGDPELLGVVGGSAAAALPASLGPVSVFVDDVNPMHGTDVCGEADGTQYEPSLGFIEDC
jgi:hypothetical protein